MKKASETKPLISVIIPVYNVEPYLKRCLDSVINQSYKKLDIVIIDDGSTDGSNIIIDKYAEKDKRISIIREKNKGISYARNAGLKNAKGSLITYIDPDDSVVNNYIEVLYSAIANNDSDVAIAGHVTRYPKRDYVHVCDKDMTISGKEACDRLLYDNGIDTSLWAKIFKTTKAIKHPFPNGQIFEDTAITGKLLADAKKISIIAKPIYYYYRRKKSITTTIFSEKKLDLIESTEEVTNYILKKYPELQNAALRRILFSNLATLSQLSESREGNEKVKNELFRNMKQMRRKVLFDRRTPKRDKAAILATYLGYSFFRKSWWLYRRIRGEA